MNLPLQILHLEDDPADAELVEEMLTGEGLSCRVRLVTTREEFVTALEQRFDLIIADYALPNFDGMSALAMVRRRHPDLPFIFVSGRLGEESAIESLKSGATDYVLKSRLSRLVPAVKRALVEAEERAELRRAEGELFDATLAIRDQAESYRTLFNSIRDLIIVTDHDRIILQTNQPALQEIFGYQPEEVAGRGVRILYADEDGYLLTGSEIFDVKEQVKGKILELNFRRKNGQVFIGELYALKRLDSHGIPVGNIGIIRDVTERKQAEAALRQSEMHRMQLHMELVYASQVQASLLPRNVPEIRGFDLAARCLPAKQVGGDFFDWQKLSSGLWSITLGDVMGKGMAAAILMATVRAALRSVVADNRPAEALRLAERALLPDLENSERFVTMFHAQLDPEAHRLTFVDCGHGYAFLRRGDGRVEELIPRGLPLGVPGEKSQEEGSVDLVPGDTLVLYSDGVVDARPELALDNATLARQLEGLPTASAMVERLVGLTETGGARPDDVTVLVVRCTG